ncbi:hypothetical protein D9M70_614630 [compost metagenome]
MVEASHPLIGLSFVASKPLFVALEDLAWTAALNLGVEPFEALLNELPCDFGGRRTPLFGKSSQDVVHSAATANTDSNLLGFRVRF